MVALPKVIITEESKLARERVIAQLAEISYVPRIDRVREWTTGKLGMGYRVTCRTCGASATVDTREYSGGTMFVLLRSHKCAAGGAR